MRIIWKPLNVEENGAPIPFLKTKLANLRLWAEKKTLKAMPRILFALLGILPNGSKIWQDDKITKWKYGMAWWHGDMVTSHWREPKKSHREEKEIFKKIFSPFSRREREILAPIICNNLY